LQLEHTPLEQDEQELLCSLPSWSRISDLPGILPIRLNFLAVFELLQKGQIGSTFSLIPFSISNIFPQSVHL